MPGDSGCGAQLSASYMADYTQHVAMWQCCSATFRGSSSSRRVKEVLPQGAGLSARQRSSMTIVACLHSEKSAILHMATSNTWLLASFRSPAVPCHCIAVGRIMLASWHSARDVERRCFASDCSSISKLGNVCPRAHCFAEPAQHRPAVGGQATTLNSMQMTCSTTYGTSKVARRWPSCLKPDSMDHVRSCSPGRQVSMAAYNYLP